jgi:hypothetical protein
LQQMHVVLLGILARGTRKFDHGRHRAIVADQQRRPSPLDVLTKKNSARRFARSTGHRDRARAPATISSISDSTASGGALYGVIRAIMARLHHEPGAGSDRVLAAVLA